MRNCRFHQLLVLGILAIIVPVAAMLFLSQASGAHAQPLSCVAAPSDMVSWWPLDTDAVDIKGTHDGILKNVFFIGSGMVDGAAIFNGITGQIDIGAPGGAAGLTELTIDAWITVDDGIGKRRIILVQQDNDDGTWGGYIEVDDSDRIRFSVQDGSTASFASIKSLSTFFPSADWIHVAGTWKRNTGDANDFKVYINGVDDTDPSSFVQFGDIVNMQVDSDTWAIGFDIRGFGTFFDGLIDELEFFNRALSGEEIQAIFSAGSAGKCKVGDLILSGPTPGTAGVENTLEASGATSGATVHFVFGTTAGSTPVPGCAGESVDFAPATVAGTGLADVSGVATLTQLVPAAAAGQTFLLQAVEVSTCRVSNLVTHTFP